MKKLYRSDTNKRLGGVCGGIGELLDLDPTIVRVAVVVLALTTGILPFVVGYIIACLVFPVGTREATKNSPIATSNR